MKIVKNVLLVLALGSSAVYAGDVLATVNGKIITTEDAELFIKGANPKQSFASASDSDKKLIVDRLVERLLFIEAAQKSGISEDKEFQENLKRATDELSISQWMKNKFDNTIVSDSEAKAFYAKNVDKFKTPKQVHARHILLKTDEAAAKKIITDLKGLTGDKLKEKFIALAKEKSEGPTGPKGGDLGFFRQGQMVPEFDKAVFALETGKVTSEAVKTQFGYHVIYVEEVKGAETMPYEQVKAQIVQNLKQTQFREAIAKITKELKSKAQIVIEGLKK